VNETLCGLADTMTRDCCEKPGVFTAACPPQLIFYPVFSDVLAAVLEGPKRLFVREVAVPRVEGYALVRSELVGICGTDKAFYVGTYPLFKRPLVPGHEVVGVVVEGPPHLVGRRVVSEIRPPSPPWVAPWAGHWFPPSVGVSSVIWGAVGEAGVPPMSQARGRPPRQQPMCATTTHLKLIKERGSRPQVVKKRGYPISRELFSRCLTRRRRLSQPQSRRSCTSCAYASHSLFFRRIWDTSWMCL